MIYLLRLLNSFTTEGRRTLLLLQQSTSCSNFNKQQKSAQKELYLRSRSVIVRVVWAHSHVFTRSLKYCCGNNKFLDVGRLVCLPFRLHVQNQVFFLAFSWLWYFTLPHDIIAHLEAIVCTTSFTMFSKFRPQHEVDDKHTIHLNPILDKIGHFGKFHLLQLFLMTIASYIGISPAFSSYAYTAYMPKYRYGSFFKRSTPMSHVNYMGSNQHDLYPGVWCPSVKTYLRLLTMTNLWHTMTSGKKMTWHTQHLLRRPSTALESTNTNANELVLTSQLKVASSFWGL